MLHVATAHYRYGGPDRLDVTVKGQHQFGKVLAPRWDMVMTTKTHGAKAHAWYIQEYHKILEAVPNHVWQELLSHRRIVFVCFCRKEDFCHRNLLVEYMRDIRRFPVYYDGWIDTP